MQYEEFVSSLNDKQLLAVESNSQYLRIVAGAGSGKTRVLTYRISYLISQMRVQPWKIVAITFTNKVANEMKNRVINIVPEASKDLTIRTFHSFAAYFLRQEIEVLGYPSNFTILDEEDQTKLVKDIAVSMNYKKNDPIIKKTIAYIGSNKLKEKYPADIKITHERFEDEKVCLEIFEEYENQKEKMSALDFDDLLLKTNQILGSYPLIQARWRNRIDHILVDEFQDTNDTEYKMIKYLLKPSASLYVVGDPDQTIYTWRGANQNIILNLSEDFPNLETVILNQNYRSTQNILDSANKLISNNKYRVPKDLYTNNIKGHEIIVRGLDTGTGEASYVAREIMSLRETQHYRYSDIVLLYRSNYLTLDFEKALMAKKIPYVIYGGIKFYQRMEIKDVLAYFRLINNYKDDISFERIINVPKRGIGETSVTLIKNNAIDHNLSLYEYISSDFALEEIPDRVSKALRNMIARIETTKKELEEDDEIFAKTLEDLISDIGYYEYLKTQEEGEDRIDNVKSLFDDLRHYLANNGNATFEEYLQNVALVSAQDDMQDGDHVTLMTVHTAKGLEFPVVFVVRLDQGIFPSNRALLEGGYMAEEEERRLAYVAYTRAKERLYLTFSGGYNYVVGTNLVESQFIKESGNSTPIRPTSFNGGYRYNSRQQQRKYGFDDIRGDDSISFDDEPHIVQEPPKSNNITNWEVGDIVIHQKFGKGVVISLEGDNIIVVDFKEHGQKTLLGTHHMISKGVK